MLPGIKQYHPEQSNIRTTEVGHGCVIHSHVWIGEKVKIGNNCKIQAFSFIPDGITIGNNVFIGPHVVFTNDRHPPSHGLGWEETKVEDGVSIGANATVLPGVVLGQGCVIGAGAVVTKSVAPGQTVKGNPAS